MDIILCREYIIVKQLFTIGHIISNYGASLSRKTFPRQKIATHAIPLQFASSEWRIASMQTDMKSYNGRYGIKELQRRSQVKRIRFINRRKERHECAR